MTPTAPPPSSLDLDRQELAALSDRLDSWRAELLQLRPADVKAIDAAHPDCRASLENLLHLAASTAWPARVTLQHLACLGLADPRETPAAILWALERVRKTVHHLRAAPAPQIHEAATTPAKARELARQRSQALWGPTERKKSPRLLAVRTVDGRSRDRQQLEDLARAGIRTLVLDPASGKPSGWREWAQAWSAACESSGTPGHLLVQLTRPMPRTGELACGPAVLRWEPRRDQLGKLLSPARLWITSEEKPEAPLQPVDAVVPVSAKLLTRVRTEDTIRFRDARGRRRELRIRGAGRSGCLAETGQTTYAIPETVLRLERRGKLIGKGTIGAIERAPRSLVLFTGDPLVLTRDQIPGRPAERDGGFLRSPARIACGLPEVFDSVRAGARVVFGHGEIRGMVDSKSSEELRIRITHAKGSGSRLQPDTLIRWPDSAIRRPTLSDREDEILAFAAKHAEAVILRGVERKKDVLAVFDRLDRHGAERVGLILDVATRRGVDKLPSMLTAALRRSPVGLQISYAGLTAEFGAARLGEALEKIHRQATAAHLPVMASSCFFDRLPKNRVFSEAEVLHALRGMRAETIVLGDGPRTTEAVCCIDGLAGRR